MDTKKPRRILLVEDDETSRLFGTIALKKKGYEVITAVDGQDAIDKSCRDDFDLIFMDINMPFVDGYCATTEIRKRSVTYTPIIAMTAYTLSSDRERCRAVGMDDFIGKPVAMAELYAKIEKWLK